jgi:hypothetical protein
VQKKKIAAHIITLLSCEAEAKMVPLGDIARMLAGQASRCIQNIFENI